MPEIVVQQANMRTDKRITLKIEKGEKLASKRDVGFSIGLLHIAGLPPQF
jgi:hypothetical protein